MDQEQWGKVRLWLQTYRWAVGLGCISLFCLVLSIFLLIFNLQHLPEPVVMTGESTVAAQIRGMLVDVAGGVNMPGVYTVAVGSRVFDAIQAAGGLSVEADLEKVEFYLNQAQRLQDGAKVLIPIRTTNNTSHNNDIREDNASHNINTNGMGNGTVSINFASQQALEALPGIGPVTAAKLINGRPYSSLEELVNRKIIGSKTFEAIASELSL